MVGVDAAVEATRDRKGAKASRLWVIAVEHDHCCTKCSACNENVLRLYL